MSPAKAGSFNRTGLLPTACAVGYWYTAGFAGWMLRTTKVQNPER
jgi:hypothetical protein